LVRGLERATARRDAQEVLLAALRGAGPTVETSATRVASTDPERLLVREGDHTEAARPSAPLVLAQVLAARQPKAPPMTDLFPETLTKVPPGATPSWFTDRGWFLAFEAELLREGVIPRPFDLDPFGHPLAPVSRLIRKRGGTVWTIDDDSLRRSWAGRVVFWNPPYDSASLTLACAKAQGERPAVDGDAALLPAWTDRGWWHDFIEPHRLSGLADVRFVRGRLCFGWPDNPEHISADSAKFPSCTVRWKR
jgi:hypothetical protein